MGRTTGNGTSSGSTYTAPRGMYEHMHRSAVHSYRGGLSEHAISTHESALLLQGRIRGRVTTTVPLVLHEGGPCTEALEQERALHAGSTLSMAELILTPCDVCGVLLYAGSASTAEEAESRRRGIRSAEIECLDCSHATQMHKKLGCPVTLVALAEHLRAREQRPTWMVFGENSRSASYECTDACTAEA